MPVCDGGSCNRSIPWRITSTALQMTSGNVHFSVDDAHRALTNELTAVGCWNIRPAKKQVAFRSLCHACWDRQAGAWGDRATYAGARAKTDATGMYFQVEVQDFTEAHRYSPDAILSCVCHELMHYWSHESTGLSAYNRTANVDWDEVVADVMGYRVFGRLYHASPGHAHYLTPYNQYCRCTTKMEAGFGNVFGRHWRTEADRGRLPTPVREYIDRHLATPMGEVKRLVTPLMSKTILEYLLTWFFLGPTSYLTDGQQPVRIGEFLTNANLSNMFAVGLAFPAYEGTNTAHPI